MVLLLVYWKMEVISEFTLCLIQVQENQFYTKDFMKEHHSCIHIHEFIQGEERCLKFVNQDVTFLQESHIPSTFTNVSHTPIPLKEPLRITLPTHISKENNHTVHTQTVQPTLGFTPAEIHKAKK